MEFIAIALLVLYLFALIKVLGNDRPVRPPRSHHVSPRNSHEMWEQATWGY